MSNLIQSVLDVGCRPELQATETELTVHRQSG